MNNLNYSIFLLIAISFLPSCSGPKHNPCNMNNQIKNHINKTDIDQIICFDTTDSYDLDLKNKSSLTVFGNLTFPSSKKKKYSVIILTHGAGGLRKYHKNYVKLLNDNGYAVFQIDHYTPRNIKYDKTFTKLSGITFMLDAFSALKLLKTHPMIDKAGYIGWSQGGVGPILSHFSYITQLINSNTSRFDAAIAIYPYCGFTLPDDSVTYTPLLIITGEKDMLTPEQTCRNLYSKFFRGDGKIQHISLEGAHHGYDNPFLLFGFTIDSLPSLTINNPECTLTISDEGKIVTMDKKNVSDPETSLELLNKCSERGVEVKYNLTAAEKTKEIILEFFKNKLIH